MPKVKPDLTDAQRRTLTWAIAHEHRRVYVSGLPDRSIQALAAKGYIVEDWTLPDAARGALLVEQEARITNARELLGIYDETDPEAPERDMLWQKAYRELDAAWNAHGTRMQRCWHLTDAGKQAAERP
jgi:hypothetical protein